MRCYLVGHVLAACILSGRIRRVEGANTGIRRAFGQSSPPTRAIDIPALDIPSAHSRKVVPVRREVLTPQR